MFVREWQAIFGIARADGVKFGRKVGSKNRSTAAKIEKIKIFLGANKTYDWIAKELSVSKQTISKIKNSLLRKRGKESGLK